MNKIKVVYIISNLLTKAYPFEWLAEKIDANRFEIIFILLNPLESSLELFLKKNKMKVYRIHYANKLSIPGALLKTYLILMKEKPQIVHTHLFEASLIGLTASKIAGIKQRYHTRHHSNSNHTYSPNAVKYDRYINKISTHIIAVSKNVSDVLMQLEGVEKSKISVVNHGLDFSEIDTVTDKRIQTLREKYSILTHQKVIGVIARYIELKGVHFIIDAFEKTYLKYPQAILVLVNTRGNYSYQIQEKLSKIPKDRYREIHFEEDLFALYQLFSIYVHTPINSVCEAFGQTYVESLACKTPSIFTLSGIANEFIVNKQNALVVPYCNSSEIATAISHIFENSTIGKQISAKGYQDVREKFDIHHKIKELETIYCKNLNVI